VSLVRSFKRNGKRLVPSSLVVLRFMAPLMLWVGAVVVISGVSYMKLQGLQGPLASLVSVRRARLPCCMLMPCVQSDLCLHAVRHARPRHALLQDLSVHVLYRLSRCRLAANFLGFSTTPQERAVHRAETLTNLALLRQDYEALLYGGRMHLLANVSFDAVAPASVFADEAVASFFFKTKQCLRKDKSTCFKPGDEWYDVTHSGLDVQVRWPLVFGRRCTAAPLRSDVHLCCCCWRCVALFLLLWRACADAVVLGQGECICKPAGQRHDCGPPNLQRECCCGSVRGCGVCLGAGWTCCGQRGGACAAAASHAFGSTAPCVLCCPLDAWRACATLWPSVSRRWLSDSTRVVCC
jgi:hypothetical protein